MKQVLLLLCFTLVSGFSSAAPPKAVNEQQIKIFYVQSIGDAKDRLYLNSEKDHQDENNITAILPLNGRSFIQQYGMSPQAYLLNRRIRVRGAVNYVASCATEDTPCAQADTYYQPYIAARSIRRM